MGRPTVLHVLEAFAGGTERHLIDLVRRVDAVEHVIAVPDHHHGRSTARAARLAAAAGATVERVSMARWGEPHQNLAGLCALRRLVQRRSPAVVHGHSSIGGAVARLATVGTGVPVVYTPHGVSRARWALAVERTLRPRTTRLIAVSESERVFVLENGLAGADRVVVIPNGIEQEAPTPPRPSLRASLGVSPATVLVGCVARLTWQKAPEVYVAACAAAARRLPEATFVLIGSGPLRPLVERAAVAAGLNGHFQLLDSFEGAAGALAELDVFVLPSRFEGAPYTPLEAMRAGVPVVVSDAAGNRDTVTPGVDGLVVPREDPRSLADAIVRLVEDSALRERLVEGGRATLPRFDVRHMASAVEHLYAELIAERRDSTVATRRPRIGERRSQAERRAAHDRRATSDRRASHARRTWIRRDQRAGHDRRAWVRGDRRAGHDRRSANDRRSAHPGHLERRYTERR
jgi:glycosyltransferase involved in cell wall biosynthesis